MLRSIAALGAAALLSIMSTGEATAGVEGPILPTVTLLETSTPGGGEYTISINSPPSTDWYIALFAVGAAESFGTLIDNEIGDWTSTILDQSAWDAGFSFEFSTPGEPEELISTTDLGLFADLFGDDSVANVYWAGSYTDYSLGVGSFSLIGPDETRDGFLYETTILASNFVALVDPLDGNLRQIVTGSAGPTAALPEPATLGLLGLGLVGLGLAARRRKTA